MTRRDIALFEMPLAVLGALAVALACAWASAGIPAWIPDAPLVRVGVPSPLSGMTRSFVAMASGDAIRAFAWHPLGPLLFVACAIAPLLTVASFARGGRLPVVERVLHSNAAWMVAGAVFAAAWIRQIVWLG